MSMQTKTIGRMPTDHGPYDPQLAYGKKFQCTLFGCAWESLHDNNNTAPAVWDGGDVITPNLVDWKKVSGSYEAWLMNKDKPATTGTTGAYPYNGMGRVVIPKKMVNGVNTLTHEAFEDSEGNDRGNTIYVIQYDFTLGEDVRIPANCVLEFDGGSIANASGNTYNLSYTTCFIKANDEERIFKDCGIHKINSADSLYNSYLSVDWFYSSLSTADDEAESIKLAYSCLTYEKELRFVSRRYKVSSIGDIRMPCDINLNNATILLTGSNADWFMRVISDESWTAVYRHSRIRDGRILGFGEYVKDENHKYNTVITLSRISGYDVINYHVENIKFMGITSDNAIIESLYCYGTTIRDCDFHYCFVDRCINFRGGRPSTGGVYYNLAAQIQNCDISPSQDKTNYGIVMSASSVNIENCVIEGLKEAGVWVYDEPKTQSANGVYFIRNCHMEVNNSDFKIDGNNYGSNITTIENCRCTDANKFIDAHYNAQIRLFNNCIRNSGGIISRETVVPDAQYFIIAYGNIFGKKSTDTNIYVDMFEASLASKVKSWGFPQTFPNGDDRFRAAVNIGSMYFDTTLGKPIWAQSIAADGTVTWIYADGTPVQTT